MCPCGRKRGGGFEEGEVINTWENGNAYRIRLRAGGMEVYAPEDKDYWVKEWKDWGMR